MGSSLCFYYYYHFFLFFCFLLRFLLHFGEDLCLVFIRTGDHKIPAHRFWFQVAWNIEVEVTKKKKEKGGQHLATKRGFLGKFLLELEWWYKVQ